MNGTRSNAGFSLVEVMCAILILGIALVGLTQGLTTALSSSKEAELHAAAALLAAGQIETLRAEGYVAEGEYEGEGAAELSRFRWKETISLTEIDGLFEVVVVVEHGDAPAPIYELRTMLFEPPLDTTASDARTSQQSPGRRDRR